MKIRAIRHYPNCNFQVMRVAFQAFCQQYQRLRQGYGVSGQKSACKSTNTGAKNKKGPAMLATSEAVIETETRKAPMAKQLPDIELPGKLRDSTVEKYKSQLETFEVEYVDQVDALRVLIKLPCGHEKVNARANLQAKSSVLFCQQCAVTEAHAMIEARK